MMKIKLVKRLRSAAVYYDRTEWIRMELSAERCGLKVEDVVDTIIRSGFKKFFAKANKHKRGSAADRNQT